jgi:FkbM family methyltransferase
MMNPLLAHPLAVKCRNLIRRSEVARSLYQRWMARRDYEENFSNRLLAAIRPGDVVWDVGANVGLYTRRFLERQAGRVVCIEPAPAAVAQLNATYPADGPYGSRVDVLPLALSNVNGAAGFLASGDDVTNRLVGANDRGPVIDVPVERADALVARGAAPMPNVVKVDVEGFELEVMQGFGDLLARRELSGVFIEIHFRLLHERSLDHAPGEIERLLKTSGFRTQWLDLSHVEALRPRSRAP